MSLTPGARLGPYEVTAQIGVGGMGEVYRARDTGLDRDVAIKVLPESVAGDPDRIARFQREAKTLAALNHPNIATIYGLEEADGVKALVMELVEGPTLADRIAQGVEVRRGGSSDPPVPVDEALAIAKQIAEALEAAHELGIIHRDLKPSNIKVRPDGTVKVLDFGLAKAMEPAGVMSSSASMSPTITTPAMTQMGMILGTAAYMSPEQAKGRPADKRSDVWAFGAVLYEMLTGRRAFDGEDVSDTLAAVLRGEPDWSALPHDVSPSLRTLLRACLEKDRRQRLGDLSGALFVLARQSSLVDATRASDPVVAQQQIDAAVISAKTELSRHARRRVVMTGTVTALAGAVLAAAAAWFVLREASNEPAPVTRFAITLPDGQQFVNIGRHLVALSPDGTRLAFAADNGLYVRQLDQLEARLLVDGEDLSPTVTPRGLFFSPDGQWIGYWQEGQLRKVSASGGTAITLCAAEQAPSGASWGADNTILYADAATGIWRVSANGGMPELLIAGEAGMRLQSPSLLPDGETVLFVMNRGSSNWDEAAIVAHNLSTGERRSLLNGGTDVRYLPTGHLVYALRGTVLAVPFDATTLSVRGGAVPVVENVQQAVQLGGIGGFAGSGASQFTWSAGGTLAYIPGVPFAIRNRRLVWVDRQGREVPVGAPDRPYVYPRISPDGSRIAVDIAEENRDIWIWDGSRGTLSRMTSDPGLDRVPVWTPDGERIVFSSDRAGGSDLYWQPVDGTVGAERLTEDPQGEFAKFVTPDGARLVFRVNETIGGDGDLMVLDLKGRRVQPLIKTPASESNAELSPDGRWMAFQSNASGRYEVYVRPWPDVDSRQWLVSTDGGREPLWARNGRELFYRDREGSVVGVSVGAGPTWSSGAPGVLLKGDASVRSDDLNLTFRTYDISRDGRRFLMIKEIDAGAAVSSPAEVIVVLNWFDELKRLVPAD